MSAARFQVVTDDGLVSERRPLTFHTADGAECFVGVVLAMPWVSHVAVRDLATGVMARIRRRRGPPAWARAD